MNIQVLLVASLVISLQGVFLEKLPNLFEDLEFDDPLDEQFLVVQPNTSQDNILSPNEVFLPQHVKLGTHYCTQRACNCWIGNCFTYCVWNWCFETNSVQGSRYYLECIKHSGSNMCDQFTWPCFDYC